MDVAGLYGNLVITASQIYLGGIASGGKPIEQIVYEWDWVTMVHSTLIQKMVVYAHLHRAILLSNKNYRCSPLGVRRLHPPFAQVLLKLRAYFIQLRLAHSILPRFGWRLGLIVQVDCVSNIALCGETWVPKNISELIADCLPTVCIIVRRVDQALLRQLQQC